MTLCRKERIMWNTALGLLSPVKRMPRLQVKLRVAEILSPIPLFNYYPNDAQDSSSLGIILLNFTIFRKDRIIMDLMSVK